MGPVILLKLFNFKTNIIDLKKSGSPNIDTQWTNRPCIGEQVSGDAVHVFVDGSEYRVVLIDALGHGPAASETANFLLNELDNIRTMNVSEVLRELHVKAHETRGAAISVVCLSSSSMGLSAATIGNTKIRILDKNGREDVASSNGTIGISVRTPKVYQRTLDIDNRVLLFTDGISSRFSDEIYTRLMYLTPKAATQMITRKFGKRFDDATAVMIAFEQS